jgi:Benzoyl-CoA reductase/2-hydroxyglutaryl-CoA dehydratase subunit, BcrC/BadD/HgdB
MTIKSNVYETLEQAYRYDENTVSEWKKQNRLVVGCIGSDVPEEVLIAADVWPVQVFGNPIGGTALAEQYLEKGFDPFTISQFEQIVAGHYKWLDRLLFSNSSDAVIRAYYYLRAIRKMEPHMPVPPLYFFDFLHTPFRMSGMYNRDRLKAFIREVEGWTGKEIDTRKLREAVRLCNRTRTLLHELNLLRQLPAPKLSGTQMLKAIGASMSMPREPYAEWLAAFLEEAKAGDRLEGVPVFVTGSPQDHSLLYEAIEGCGGIVAGEDHEMGFRHVQDLVDEQVDPIDGIVDRYHLRSPVSGQATVSRRVQDLMNAVEQSNTQAVVFYVHEKHDAISWDYPSQRQALEEKGIPVLLLEDQPYGPITAEAKGQIKAFMKSVKGGRA